MIDLVRPFCDVYTMIRRGFSNEQVVQQVLMVITA